MYPLATDPSALVIVWYVLIVVLWLGYFFLEGFDYGVAMLLPILGKNDKDRRVMVNTIGPVWDGNEVWLLTAGGATFAAFPGWYATLFSGLYLPLFLVLVGLILRGVSFDYRHKGDSQKWKNNFDMAAAVGSLLPALVFGVGFANFFAGIPVKPAEPAGHMVDGSAMWAGSFLGLFTPFTLLGGVLLVALCITHGAVFLSLKTRGEIRTRARVFGVRAALVTAVLMAVFVLWANLAYVSGGVNSTLTWIVGILSVAGLAAAWYSLQAGREGWSFIATGVSIVTFALMVFIKMFGNLGFANMDPANPLNMATAASSNTTLFLMTIAAVIFVPIVIAYQAWSYWVFRRRISVKNLPVEVAPAS